MNREKNLETLLTISTGLLVFYFISDIKILIAAAAIISIMGLLSNLIADKITWIWYKIAQIMGSIMSRIILSAVFYVFLCPISFLYKIFKKDSLQLKRRSTGSYYSSRDQEYSAKDFENVW